MLLLIEILAVIAYLDLWAVYRFKVHLYSPLLKYVPKTRLKPFQQLYYSSLRRDFFCVSDKIDVSGTTFTVMFVVLYTANALSNLFYQETITHLHFYLVGVPYFVYLMFALTLYKSPKELCFYCRFTMI